MDSWSPNWGLCGKHLYLMSHLTGPTKLSSDCHHALQHVGTCIYPLCPHTVSSSSNNNNNSVCHHAQGLLNAASLNSISMLAQQAFAQGAFCLAPKLPNLGSVVKKWYHVSFYVIYWRLLWHHYQFLQNEAEDCIIYWVIYTHTYSESTGLWYIYNKHIWCCLW